MTQQCEGHELTDVEGLICWAANSISEPLCEVAPGVVFIKTEAAEAILQMARYLSGDDSPLDSN